jgi:hypothetical protein
MCYESALLINLILLSIILGIKYFREIEYQRPTITTLVVLAVIWSLLFLTRPDAIILVGIESISIFFSLKPLSLSHLRTILAALFFSLIPAFLYYGYSFIELGAFSVSGSCRAFALQEKSSHLFGVVSYSLPSIIYLLLNIPLLYLAGIGIKKMQGGKYSWLSIYCLLVVLTYCFLLTFVSPVSDDLPRYYLPMTSVLLIPIGIGVSEIGRKLSLSPRNKKFASSFYSAIIIFPLAFMWMQVIIQLNHDYHFDEIMEREAVEIINRQARKNDIVLAYEVQDRYYLRDDISILSLDGITDGKVYEFMKTGALYDFLMKERPRFWIANDAIEYRAYLRKSFLHEIYEQFLKGSISQFKYKGILFSSIATREKEMPKGFSGWRLVLKLDYEDNSMIKNIENNISD